MLSITLQSDIIPTSVTIKSVAIDVLEFNEDSQENLSPISCRADGVIFNK